MVELNPAQKKAVKHLHRLLKKSHVLESDDSNTVAPDIAEPKFHEYTMLLRAPAGAGKTTTILEAFRGTGLNIAFAAFTNKAASVLRNMQQRQTTSQSGDSSNPRGFTMTFSTIHSLLHLRQRYTNGTDQDIAFDFDLSEVYDLADYDVLVFDECSTISGELLGYIKDSWEYIRLSAGKLLRIVFLGDRNQLLPVGERGLPVFADAYNYLVRSLTQVMRATNPRTQALNENFQRWIQLFDSKSSEALKYAQGFPFNTAVREHCTVHHGDSFVEQFMQFYRTGGSCIILTYSNVSVDMYNEIIQNSIDEERKDVTTQRPQNAQDITPSISSQNEDWYFHKGDRFISGKPTGTYTVQGDTILCKAVNEANPSSEIRQTSIYNGEIMEIVDVQNSHVKTNINRVLKEDFGATLECQILTFIRLEDKPRNVVSQQSDGTGLMTSSQNVPQYQLIYINPKTIAAIRTAVFEKYTGRAKFRAYRMMKDFTQIYPTLRRGYAMTVYLSQGSEWENVLVDTADIKRCVGRRCRSLDDHKNLFRSAYVAFSRAKESLHITNG